MARCARASIRPRPRRPAARPTLLVGLLAHVLAASLAAQTDDVRADVDTPGLVIEATAGWDGIVDRSTPIPLSFLVRNDSGQILEGRLRITDPMNGYDVLLEEIVVSPGTSRRVTSIQAMTGWYECYAALSNGPDVLWRRELPLAAGQIFNANVNYALFLDDGGRRLQLPGLDPSTAAGMASELSVAGELGRPVQCLSVKTWQAPNHPGPLVAAQAVIFPEGASRDSLNQVQWRAVAEWMCQGGVVFAHRESTDLIERLTRAAPLVADPDVPSGPFVVRRVGLGAVYEYAQPLLPSEGEEVRGQISEIIARLPRAHVDAFLDATNWYYQRGGRADLNRLVVIAFFAGYTFLTGFVALLLFRLSQRRIAIYTLVVIVGASALSGLLGGYLRFSRGDLHWLTVTQAGAGGAVQVGRIEVQSAGGRNTRVAVRGMQADLQFIHEAQGYGRNYYGWYGWMPPRTNCPPFTWQPNGLAAQQDAYQARVTMTPWGRRRLHATAYRPDFSPLDFRLQFRPRDAAGGTQADGTSPEMPQGEFSLTLVNRLPMDLTSCWLVIGASRFMPTDSNTPPATPLPRGWVQLQTPSNEGLIDVYQRHQVSALSAGGTHQESFNASFQIMQNAWELSIPLPGASLSPPRIDRLGTASAWVIAILEDSPMLTIDEAHSEFIPRQHLHLYIQEIRPEDMADARLFLGTAPGAEQAPTEDASR